MFIQGRACEKAFRLPATAKNPRSAVRAILRKLTVGPLKMAAIHSQSSFAPAKQLDVAIVEFNATVIGVYPYPLIFAVRAIVIDVNSNPIQAVGW